MKTQFFLSLLTVALIPSLGNAHPENCRPNVKIYCACETQTHGAYYGVAIMKLDLDSGARRVLTTLKPYNLEPYFIVGRDGDFEKCRAYMRNFDECSN